jgi:hypothetical protein
MCRSTGMSACGERGQRRSTIVLQKFAELEGALRELEAQEAAHAQQVTLATVSLRSTVMALLQQSRDVLAFFVSHGYVTPPDIDAVLNKIAASKGRIPQLAEFVPISELAGAPPLVSPEVSAADARVLDWVAASSASCTTRGAPATLSASSPLRCSWCLWHRHMHCHHVEVLELHGMAALTCSRADVLAPAFKVEVPCRPVDWRAHVQRPRVEPRRHPDGAAG